MKQKKIVIGFLLAALVIVIVTIALLSNSTSQSNGAVKIGVVLPLTGDAAVYGKALKNGIELALEEYEKGEGVPVKLIYEDDRYVPKDSVSAVQKLISLDKVQIIIGGAGSSTAEPITAICDRNKVVLLSPCATAPSLSNAGPYFFRMWPSDTYDGTIMAEVAFNKLKARRVNILYVNAPYGQGISQVFTEQFEKLGGKIGISESYSQGATDFRVQLLKVKNDEAEWVFLPGYINETTNIVKQAMELGLKARFLGVNSMHDPKLIEIAGPAAEGAVFSIPTYDVESEDPGIRTFVKAYKIQYGSAPDTFAATGFDSLRVVLKAINLSEGKTGQDIQKAMLQIQDYVGPSGTISFDENGDVQKPLKIMMVKNGEFTNVE